jgi:hypothetical protein
MKLSEAILLGSVSSEQGQGTNSMFRESVKKCALGAALHAEGTAPSRNDDDNNPYRVVRETWPFVTEYILHPIEGKKRDLLSIIYNLNDCHGWTRPQIAAWVATVEPQEEDKQSNGGVQLGKEEVQLR